MWVRDRKMFTSKMKLSVIFVLFLTSFLRRIDATRHHHHHRSTAVQVPIPVAVTSPRQALVSPTICAAVTGFLVGIGIGIGFGALIFNRPYRNGGFGGGVWFGRRKRSLDQISPQYEEYDFEEEEETNILRDIQTAEQKFETFQK